MGVGVTDPWLQDGTGRRTCRNCGDIYRPHIGHWCAVKPRGERSRSFALRAWLLLLAVVWLASVMVYVVQRFSK